MRAEGSNRTLVQRLTAAAAVAGAGFLLFAVLHFATRPLSNGDQFWQVRTGEIILDTLSLPRTDRFSYTVPGTVWNNHQWGYEVLAACLHRAAGWGGFRLAILLLVGGAVATTWVVVARRAGPALATLVATVFLLLASYKFIPASQTLALAMFMAAEVTLLRTPHPLRPRWRYAALLCLMLMWGNLTAEALVFLPFVLVACGSALWLQRRHSGSLDRTDLLLLGLVCVAPLVNPPGSSVLDYALTGSAVNREVNVEFTRLWEPAITVVPFAKWMARALVALFVVAAVARLARSGDRVTAARRWLPGLLCVAAAVIYERYLWMLVYPAARLSVELAWIARPTRGWPAIEAAALAAAIMLFVPFATVLNWSPGLAWRHLTDPGYRAMHLDAATVPMECGETLAALPRGTKVFTSRPWGNYVIWRAPDARVFIDGRNREYPLQLHLDSLTIWDGAVPAGALLEAWHTDIVLAYPGWNEGPGVSAYSWRPRFTGRTCTVYER